jgi:hypothetical protein
MTETASASPLRLADGRDFPAERLVALETRIATGPEFAEAFDLVHKGIGEKIPQGSLLAYLFRRFGYPNKPSDPYKDLASYLLTTSRPDMLMSITPYAGGDTSISIRFLVDVEVAATARSWPYRALHAHRAAFPRWLEDNDLLPGDIQELRKEAVKAGFAPPTAIEATLEQVLTMIGLRAWKANRDGTSDARVEWLKDMEARYEADHPKPEIQERSADMQDWPDDDPIKPYAKAIIDTLRELTWPVWVRDVPIDPWGKMDDDDAMDRVEKLGGDIEEEPVPYAASAGYAAGALANADPETFAALMGLVYKLGEGTPENGLTKALDILQAAVSDKTTQD